MVARSSNAIFQRLRSWRDGNVWIDRAGAWVALGYGAGTAVLAALSIAARGPLMLASATAGFALASAVIGWMRHRSTLLVLALTIASAAALAVATRTSGWMLGLLAMLAGLAIASLHGVSAVASARARAATKSIPVAVITGFLGSGKTTLLNRLLADPAMAKTAVIINELGEISIDHLLVERVDERMMALSSGCVCCTVRGDLLETLQVLMMRAATGRIPPIERVLVETTGMADPAPILHALMASPAALQRCRLDGVVTVVDSVCGTATLAAHPEARKQVAVADRLLLSKTDLVAPDDLAPLVEQLRAINPGATLLGSAGDVSATSLFGAGGFDRRARPEELEAWLAAPPEQGSSDPYHRARHRIVAESEHAHDHSRESAHDPAIHAYCVTRGPLRGAALTELFDALVAQYGDRLLRVKGIICVAERPATPAVIHGVQHIFHPVRWLERWPSDDHRSRIVFITRGVAAEDIERVLTAVEAEATVREALR